jgi:hypothetical protein
LYFSPWVKMKTKIFENVNRCMEFGLRFMHQLSIEAEY